VTPALQTLDHALTAWTEARIVVRQSTLLADGRADACADLLARIRALETK
jgi:hypothetical protein